MSMLYGLAADSERDIEVRSRLAARGARVSMDEAPFTVVVNQRTHMVMETATGRSLGAVGSNYYRPWVFPLYTPSGQTVLREFPFDHPFHTGAFVAQNPVQCDGVTANFWAMPPRRSADDALFTKVGRVATDDQLRIAPHTTGVTFSIDATWLNDDEAPVLNEHRTVDLHAEEEATMCDITSEKRADFGSLLYPKTKFGSVGVRVEPRLLPTLGGTILADQDRCGDADIVHEQDSRFVAYEADLAPGRRGGVALAILQPDVRGPWFVRDYGLALFNPTWREDVQTPNGESWTVALRVIAYDGALTDERIDRWLAAAYRQPASTR